MKAWKTSIHVVGQKYAVDKALADCTKGLNDLKSPSPLSTQYGSASPSIMEGQTSIMNSLRLPMLPASDDLPSTRLSNPIFNLERFEKNIQAIRETNPFWFSPFRSSTLPPGYDSPSTGVSSKTLDPDQFQKHLEDIRRDTNIFCDLEAFGDQDGDPDMEDWDPILGTPSTPTFKLPRKNSLVFNTPAFEEFDDLRYSLSIHESVDKAQHRTQGAEQLSFEEIFQIHQEPQVHSSPSPKRKREALDRHKKSTHAHFNLYLQKNPLCIFKNERSTSTTRYQQSNPLGTMAAYDQEFRHQESPSSSSSSPPPKRRKVELEGKGNDPPFVDGENKTKPVWSRGKTGATKRRFLREKKMQQGSFFCPPIQRTGCFQEDENLFMCKIMFDSSGKGSSNHERNEVHLSKPVNHLNAEALSYCPPPNSPNNFVHQKEKNSRACHLESPLRSSCDNTTESSYINFSPLSTSQLSALHTTTITNNLVQTMSTPTRLAKRGEEDSMEGGRLVEVQTQPPTSNQATIDHDLLQTLLREAMADFPHGIPHEIFEATMKAWTKHGMPVPLLHPRNSHTLSDIIQSPPAANDPSFAQAAAQHQLGGPTHAAVPDNQPQALDGMANGFPAANLNDASKSDLGPQVRVGCSNCHVVRNTPKRLQDAGLKVKCRTCGRVVEDGKGESSFFDNDLGKVYDDAYVEWLMEWVLEVVEPLKR